MATVTILGTFLRALRERRSHTKNKITTRSILIFLYTTLAMRHIIAVVNDICHFRQDRHRHFDARVTDAARPSALRHIPLPGLHHPNIFFVCRFIFAREHFLLMAPQIATATQISASNALVNCYIF